MPRGAHVWSDSRAPFCPSDAKYHFLGDRPAAGQHWAGLADLGSKSPAHGWLSDALLRTYNYYAIQRGWPSADARLYAFWIVLAKAPHAVGLLRYWIGTFIGRRCSVIDYRGPTRVARSIVG